MVLAASVIFIHMQCLSHSCVAVGVVWSLLLNVTRLMTKSFDYKVLEWMLLHYPVSNWVPKFPEFLCICISSDHLFNSILICLHCCQDSLLHAHISWTLQNWPISEFCLFNISDVHYFIVLHALLLTNIYSILYVDWLL